MIIRTVLLAALFITSLFSDSFYFTEERYSDALERSIKLNGEITFEKESLHIRYTKSDREILYKNSLLTLKEGGKTVELGDVESGRISQYFEILLLLHGKDETILGKKFDVQKKDQYTILVPKDYMRNFLEMIKIKKSKQILKEVELFFKNNDTIIISIEDEIR